MREAQLVPKTTTMAPLAERLVHFSRGELRGDFYEASAAGQGP